MTRLVVAGTALAEALATVEPFASRDDFAPNINAVRFIASGDTVILAATNRYAIAEWRMHRDGENDPWEFSLPAAAARDWITRIKKVAAAVTVTVDGDKATLELPTGETTTALTYDGEWMAGYERFLDATQAPGEHAAMRFNVPNVLEVLVKVFKRDRADLLFRFGATPEKPVLVTRPGMEQFRAAVMPMRLPVGGK